MKPHPSLRRRLHRAGVVLSLGFVALATTGCVMFHRPHTARSSSVVSFLFPKEQPPPVTPGLPVLQLPLRVGIGFVPEEMASMSAMTEQQKQVLMQRIAADFRSLPIVQSIQTIPTLYLRPGGSFTNLDQVQRLLGVDVIVLLSYDQTQVTAQNRRALAYWTIIGAYFVNGNQNDTHTLMEATVYDISSRTLLFHSPGADLTHATSTLVTAEREMRADRDASLERATNDLVKNLQAELATFRQTVKEGRSNVKVEHRPGYAGGGALDATTTLLAVSALVGGVACARRSRKRTSRRDSLTITPAPMPVSAHNRHARREAAVPPRLPNAEPTDSAFGATTTEAVAGRRGNAPDAQPWPRRRERDASKAGVCGNN